MRGIFLGIKNRGSIISSSYLVLSPLQFRTPPFNYAYNSSMHMTLIIVHPPSREATLLQLCAPRFHGENKTKSQCCHKKIPSIMHPWPAKQRPFIMQVQTYLGGGKLPPSPRVSPVLLGDGSKISYGLSHHLILFYLPCNAVQPPPPTRGGGS